MKTTPDKIIDAAKEHISLYEARLESKRQGKPSGRFVHEADCKKYLAIWQSILAKGGENLTAEEANEVKDAYDSGDYDHIFKRTN